MPNDSKVKSSNFYNAGCPYKLSLQFQKFTIVLFFKIFSIGLFYSKRKCFKFRLDALVHSMCDRQSHVGYNIQPIVYSISCYVLANIRGSVNK